MRVFKFTYILLIGIGILIGYFASSINTPNKNEGSKNEVHLQAVKPVKEDEIECPIISDNFLDNAKVTFLPVLLLNSPTYTHKDLNKEFDAAKFSQGLYNFETGKENKIEQYPWYVEDFDTYNDLGKLIVYYGNTAMNHTPHMAYVVKDNKVIFIASGANIHVETSNPNGLETTETLDWNTGKYKRTKFEYKNGSFIPTWYQISCKVI